MIGMKNNNGGYINLGSTVTPKSYYWIEEDLLKTPITDYRKKSIDLLLVPYFIVIKRLSALPTYETVREWLLKCDSAKRLKPSIYYFESRTKIAIKNSLTIRIPLIRSESIKMKYADWYNELTKWGIL